jgi:hypothetical protein
MYTGKRFKQIHKQYRFIKYLESNNLSGLVMYGGGYRMESKDCMKDISFSFGVSGCTKPLQYCFNCTIPDDALIKIKMNRWEGLTIYSNKLILLDEKPEQWYINNISRNCNWFHNIKHPSNDICLLAVKKNGEHIQHIKNPSEEVCLTAIRDYIYSFRHIAHENQTERLCVEVINAECRMLKYVRPEFQHIFQIDDNYEYIMRVMFGEC